MDRRDLTAKPKYVATQIRWEDSTHIHMLSRESREDDVLLSQIPSLVPDVSIPKVSLLAKLPLNISPLPLSLPDQSYVKRVDSTCVSADMSTKQIAMDTEREVGLWEEVLKTHPHPNICDYRGIISEDGEHITGIVLKDYRKDLQELVVEGSTFDIERTMLGLRAGIEHLHSLGYVHVSSFNLLVYSNPQAVSAT